VKGRGLIRSDEDDEAIHYFMTILPRIKRKASTLRNDPDYRDFACYEFTQHAGQTVFVPHGWHHAVLNVTHTVGVTQNFCSPRNFEHVWYKTRSSRKRLAWKWLCQLEKHYPELAAKAVAMNKRDNFVMKYDPVEVKKRREEQERRRKMQRIV
jgi:histone arginine demethylase JMJD6